MKHCTPHSRLYLSALHVVCLMAACTIHFFVCITPAHAQEAGEIAYQFERMWPTLPQPWYNSTVEQKEPSI